MADAGDIAVDIAMLGGIGLAMAVMVKAVGSIAPNLPGGKNFNQQPPASGGASNPNQGGPLGGNLGLGLSNICQAPGGVINCPNPIPNCDNAPAVGSTFGKQFIIAPNSQPNCSTLTYPQFQYGQWGYIDPNTGQAAGTGVYYAVWRCLNKITQVDDGWYYLSPVCSGY